MGWTHISGVGTYRDGIALSRLTDLRRPEGTHPAVSLSGRETRRRLEHAAQCVIGNFLWGVDDERQAKAAEQMRWLCTPRRADPKNLSQNMTGIDPRHRPHPLSLLPSGPDEVRDRLLRGGRPK